MFRRKKDCFSAVDNFGKPAALSTVAWSIESIDLLLAKRDVGFGVPLWSVVKFFLIDAVDLKSQIGIWRKLRVQIAQKESAIKMKA